MEQEIKLTVKQQLFIYEYLKLFNAAQAARNAGYSKKTADVTGRQNLRKPTILKAIRKELNKILGDRKESAVKTIKEIEKIAFNDIGEYIETVEKKNPTNNKQEKKLQFKDLSEVDTSGIESIDLDSGKVTKFKLHNKTKALELLSKINKLIDDKHSEGGIFHLELNIQNDFLPDPNHDMDDDTVESE
jgi:phage terminase small subunit